MRRFAYLVVLAACGTSRPVTANPMPPADAAVTAAVVDAPRIADAPAVTIVDATPTVDALTIRKGLYAACPTSFAAAQAGGPCTFTYDDCVYPEGSCTCAPPPWCGGAAPPPDHDKHRSWQCTPDVRPDGCPGFAPNSGQPCTTANKKCEYTCGCIRVATCTNGAWKMERGPCVP